MQQKRYDIDKCDNEWIVSANGNGLLRCSQKKMALEIAEKAAQLLGSHERIREDIGADALENSVRQGG